MDINTLDVDINGNGYAANALESLTCCRICDYKFQFITEINSILRLSTFESHILDGLDKHLGLFADDLVG